VHEDTDEPGWIVTASLGNRKAALSYLRQAVERDWLHLQYFDYDARPEHGSHTMRNDPEFCALRNEVALKVEGAKEGFPDRYSTLREFG
jgi:hypothetical protein